MVFFCPKQCIGYKEILYLGTSVIVDQSSPVRMHTLPGVQMLIKAGSVKGSQSERILREMGRHPVQDHADSLLMHIIHKIHKVLRGSVPAGGRIITGHLIAPGSIKRMLHNRHQLYMSVSHLFNIFCQHGRDLPVIIERSAILRVRFFPGSQVEFVDCQRFFLIMKLLSGLHPGIILPLVLIQVCDYRSCLWTQFSLVSVGVCF